MGLLAAALGVRVLRVAVTLGIVALAFLALASVAPATHGTNVFSGQWNTTLYDGSAGMVTFKVVSDADGAAGVAGLGGQACGAPTTYYRGDYSDQANPHGTIYACIVTAGHLVGRFKSDKAGTDAGDIDIAFAAPSSFSGHFIYQGSSYAYSGTFGAHTPDDGCCPGGGTTTGTTGSTTGTTGTTGTTTGTTGSTTGTTGSTTGTTGDAGCGATASAVHVALACPPKPAVTPAEKDAASDKANSNLALMVVFCLFSDPEAKSDICSFAFEMAAFVGEIANDPPSAAFAHVHIAAVPRVGPRVRLFCPNGCPSAAGAINAFAQALARAEAAMAGLVTAANRYSGARLVNSASGMLLQAGVSQAYAGVLADALVSLSARATVLSGALARVGIATAVSSAQVSQVVTALQTTGLPAAYARRLPAGGISATALAQTVAAAVASPPAPVAFAQALQLSPPPAAFRAANATMTVAELAAVVDQLASQHAISRRARTQLREDLTAITRAGSPAAHARALTRLRSDIYRMVRTTRPATETLLQHAAAGLS